MYSEINKFVTFHNIFRWYTIFELYILKGYELKLIPIQTPEMS